MTNAPLIPLTPEGLVPSLNPTLVSNGAGLMKVESYFKRLADQGGTPTFAADYETNITPTFFDRRVRTLQVGDKNEQYVIDFLEFAQSPEALIAGQGNYKPAPWVKAITDVIEPAFNSSAFLKVGQNMAYEYEQSSWCLGMRLWNMYSIDIAERLLWAGLHSFKDLKFYSMAQMAARHFNVSLDKSLQQSFDMCTPLTDEQIIYTCFDLRMPLAIRGRQMFDLADNGLGRINKIENDAIGFFVDIHLNGLRTDKVQWSGLVSEWLAGKREAIKLLDTQFMPVVGKKEVNEQNLDPILEEWKSKTVDSQLEIDLKGQLKAVKSKEDKEPIRERIVTVATARKAEAAIARKRYTDLRSAINMSIKNADTYEGESAINYSSNAQLRKALLQMKGFSSNNLPSTDDGVLAKLAHKPVIAYLRDYRTYSKLLETYGPQWITPYIEKPSSEEGWVNPNTGRIHSTIYQLEAETGRTSSVKPNVQNLPHDDRVRACFVADPPDESIRISTCCESEAAYSEDWGGLVCPTCQLPCDARAEDFVIVTVDMSGAELRIIAEESGSKVWIDAFNNNWDVHSVGTELLYPEAWPAATCTPGEIIIKDGKEVTLPPCAYFHKDHQKCKCPKHMVLRDGNKATNFLLAYGGGAGALADAIGKTEGEAKELMRLHEAANPEVWDYLERSGEEAKATLESRSKCGRRRQFAPPNWDVAKEYAREKLFENMKKNGLDRKINLDGTFTNLKLEDCHPTSRQISSAMRGMSGSIERRGKNHRIQSLNATIAKVAGGSGFDKDGKPYMWHLLPKHKAKLINFIHDEFVIHCPARFGKAVLELVEDAIRRAGAEFLEKVVMEAEGRISNRWQK